MSEAKLRAAVAEIKDRLSDWPGVQFVIFRPAAAGRGTLQVVLNPHSPSEAQRVREAVRRWSPDSELEIEVQPGKAELQGP